MLVIAAGLNMKLEMEMDMETTTRTDGARLVFGFGSLRFGFLPFGLASFAYRHFSGNVRHSHTPPTCSNQM